MLSPGLGHWGADARPGDVIAFFCVERDTTTLHTHLLTPPPPPPPRFPCVQARWRRGESVSMMSAREQMLSYEQLQYIPKPKL